MLIKKYFVSIFISLVLLSFSALAQQFPNVQTQNFIRVESSNDYQPDTTVSEAYRPHRDRIYKLNYLEIPVSDLNITDSHIGSENLRKQILIKKDKKNYFRFFIHPDSEALYQPLIERYGWAGFYWASATSSTRSVIAWNPSMTEPPLYLKLSLAQYQDRLGRIIPDWEVRRSVGISTVTSETSSQIWRQHGASIIPEFIGATVKRKEGLGFYVDENQKEVFEHGLIAREADFLTSDSKYQVMPLFSLFTKRGTQPPLIISLWKNSGQENFYDFVDHFLFKSFLEKNSYLFFQQGIVPEIHGQNVLIAFDAKTKQILHYYHRDVGSMSVDIRLRYIRGLNVAALRSENAAYDYKFARATEKYESVYMDYLNDLIFRWTYLDTLRQYIPNFDPEKTKSRLRKRLLDTVRLQLPLKSKSKSPVKYKTVEEHLKAFYDENPPLNWKPIDIQTNPDKVTEFIQRQRKRLQFVELPASWIPSISFLNGDILFTEYGLLKIEKDKSLRLYYYSSQNLKELSVPKAFAIQIPKIHKRSSVKKVGFYSGTFDPPHAGHLKLLQNAIKELQLDIIYVIPNADPSHKPDASKNINRLEMARLAFAQIPQVLVADPQHMDIVLRDGIGGYQRYLSALHKEDLIFQIMGDDSYERIKENPHFQFPKNFVIAVAARDNNFELLETSYGQNRVVSITPDLRGYSSTQFRNQIKAGERPNQLDPIVFNYITSKGLYKNKILHCEQIFAALTSH